MQKINYWIKASRPQTLIASLAPVCTASILCYKKYDHFSVVIFLLTVISAVLIQIMTNLINDLYDYKKGSDKSTRLGPDRMVQKGYLKPKEIKIAVAVLLFLAVLSGFYLVLIGGWIILLVGLSSFLLAYLYTATKFSIAYNGFGEVFVFVYFGIIASTGAFFLQTGSFTTDALLIGVIFGFLNMALLIINNLRDYNEDLISNKKTLVVLLGVNFGEIELFLSLFSPFIATFYLLPLNELIAPPTLYCFFIIILLSLYIYINSVKNNYFLINRALPLTAIYIFLYAFFLIFNI